MEEPTDQFAEALALAQEIAKDCARAFRVDKKFFVYNYNEEVRKFLVGLVEPQIHRMIDVKKVQAEERRPQTPQ